MFQRHSVMLCLFAIVIAVTIEQCLSAPSKTDQEELVSELKQLLRERHLRDGDKGEEGDKPDKDEDKKEEGGKPDKDEGKEEQGGEGEGDKAVDKNPEEAGTKLPDSSSASGGGGGGNRSLDMGFGAIDLGSGFERSDNLERGLTQAQKDRIVEYHNELRKKEGAANMETLRWSDRLAQLAQEWANRCAWGHRPPNSFKPQDYGVPSAGENIWAWSADVHKIPDKPIDDWYNEKNFYDFNSGNCRKQPCGHYTTVVCPKTTQVGCGFKKCSSFSGAGFSKGVYMVCNYGPWGIDKPIYKKGTSCTECDSGQFFCTKNLCDSTCKSSGSGKCECKASCKNGATKTSDCKCKCKGGFSGPACSDRCEDKDRQCGGNPGWPASWCTDKNVFGGMMYETVRSKCPKMCKLCKARSYEEDAKDMDDAQLEFLIDKFEFGREK